MEKIIYFTETDGISIEHMVRQGKFDMSVKHFHNEYEIFYLIEGERQFFFDNRVYNVKSGTLILVDENAIHMTRALREDEMGHNRVILYINKDKMKELDLKFPYINFIKFFHDHYGVYTLNEQQQAHFMSFYQALKEEFDSKHRNYRAMIDIKIIQYFIEFMRENIPHTAAETKSSTKSHYHTVYSVADYISEHYDQSFSLEELANQFFLSKYYLCRVFKKITGYGINEYVNIHRIQKAKRLLEETNLSISEISQLIGYESLTYFEKIFKTYMTISPLKYRKTLNTITYTHKL